MGSVDNLLHYLVLTLFLFCLRKFMSFRFVFNTLVWFGFDSKIVVFILGNLGNLDNLGKFFKCILEEFEESSVFKISYLLSFELDNLSVYLEKLLETYQLVLLS